MAKTIKVTTFNQLGENPPVYTATGSCDDKAFSAKTIMYGKKGEKQPIFKVEEEGKLATSLKTSGFTRGERIAIARYLKLMRLGEIDKPAPVIEHPVERPDASRAELLDLSVKQLRAQCKDLGLKGYFKRGINKGDLIDMIVAA